MKHKRDEKEKKRRHRSRSKSRSRSPIQESKSNDKHTSSGGGDDVLSIEETNKLRLQLGLKPLESNNETTGKDGEPAKKDFIHVPAKNLSDLKRSENMKAKLELWKAKRNISDKLAKVKTLGEADDEEEDSAAAWVKKQRRTAKEKEMAEKRSKMLAEMDEAFGVSELVQEDLKTKPITQKKSHDSFDLEGVTVEHSFSRFKEGSTVIMTLKDKGVLDTDSDDQVLINVNIHDDEAAQKRLNQAKIASAGYQAYADSMEAEREDAFKMPALLSKYDEAIDGEKKERITLGRGGGYVGDHERILERMKMDMQRSGLALVDTDYRLASDYYTEEEMDAKFKKRKRKVKGTRSKMLTADDLVPLEEPGHHGSRTKSGHIEIKSEASIEPNDEPPVTNGSGHKATVESHPMVQDEVDSDEELANMPAEPDEAEEELQKALAKVRKLQQKQAKTQPNQIADMVSRKREADVKEEPTIDGDIEGTSVVGLGKSLVLNSMTELCRSIGEFTQGGGGGAGGSNKFWSGRDELGSDAEEELGEEDMEVEPEPDATARTGGGWQEVDEEVNIPVKLASYKAKRASEHRGVLHDEPQLNQGLAAALSLASKKGYVEKDKEEKASTGQFVNLMAKNCVKEEMRYDDIDAKFRKKDRFNGPLSDFSEKSGYKPNVKLDYVDEAGRELNTKEAFRQLSHRFHGKGSGKNKLERRMKKNQEEIIMKTMSSSDTPLGTAEKLHKKLESEKQPYVVLSGKSATLKNLSK